MFDGMETPRLVLDKTRLQQNIGHFSALARKQGLQFRPHMKTAKSVDVADLATAGNRSRITVSTLKEAAYFAAQGYRDILCSTGITANKLPRVAEINTNLAEPLLLVTDNLFMATELCSFAVDRKCELSVLVEIDCGEHRGGLDKDDLDLLKIAKCLRDAPYINFKGLMTHAGHTYSTNDPEVVATIAEVERSSVVRAAERLAANAIPCEIVSSGSTPSLLFGRSFEGLTEIRCGVFMFYDLSQYSRNVCGLDQIALTVLATVIGHNKTANSLIIDAGAFALSKDIGANSYRPEVGYGLVCDANTTEPYDGLSVHTVHQEHGGIPIPDDSWFQRLPIGSQVRIFPNHACPTAAAHDSYLVIENDKAIAHWPRIGGW